MTVRVAAASVAVALAVACGGVRRADEARSPPPRPEAPDAREERGPRPVPDRPRVPATPEGLLAEGAVGDVQEALAARGLLGSHRRGELDEPTSRALRAFQTEEGLAETGFPDRETLSRLGMDPEDAYGRE